MSSMGLWERLLGDRYEHAANAEIDDVQKQCGVTFNNRMEHVVGLALAQRIQAICKQGGERHYRSALALWQKTNAIYPAYVRGRQA